MKIHANASVSSLIANSPITHVEPSIGISVAADIKVVLKVVNWNKNMNITTY